MAESFFSSLEFECRDIHDFADLEDAQEVTGAYIEDFHNPERMHSTIGYRSPIEFEIASALSKKAA